MENFNLTYIIIYSFVFLTVFSKTFLLMRNKSYSLGLEKTLLTVFFVLILFLFSFRDVSVGTDTRTYYLMRESYINGSYESIKDFGFYFLVKITAPFGRSFFLFFCALMYLLPLYILVIKLKKSSLFIFFSFISCFFFLNMGINIMRQGIALSFILLSFYYFFQNKKKRFFILSLIGTSFHFSVIILPILLIFLREYLSVKKCLLLLSISIIISYFGGGIIESIGSLPGLSFLYEERLKSYIEYQNTIYNVGFRFDFLLFNLFFLSLFLMFIKMKLIHHSYYKEYIILLKLYILLTSFFVLSFNMPYSDRVGIMSWVLIPFLQCPIFDFKVKKNNSMFFVFFVYNVLLFTLFI